MMSVLMDWLWEYKRFAVLLLLVLLGVTIVGTVAYVTATNDIQISPEVMMAVVLVLALIIGLSLSRKKSWLAISWSVPMTILLGIRCGMETNYLTATSLFFGSLMIFMCLMAFLLSKIYSIKRVVLVFTVVTLLTMFVAIFLRGLIGGGTGVVEAFVDWLVVSSLFVIWTCNVMGRWNEDTEVFPIIYRTVNDTAFLLVAVYLLITNT
ncbi:MAG: hypothetical protein KIH89_003280 [Candidatus Shapirobacteria bacterium]|nr:hypothetical protein [Candidatus Shapirobacteria bacterium]